MKPTTCLSPPFLQQHGPLGRRCLMLHTDIGIITISEASAICGIPIQTLWTRNKAENGTGWKRPNFFSKGRSERVVTDIPTPATITISEDDDIDEMGKDRRSPYTIELGTWERKRVIKAECPVEREKKARRKEFLSDRRQEYNSALRLNRMMAR